MLLLFIESCVGSELLISHFSRALLAQLLSLVPFQQSLNPFPVDPNRQENEDYSDGKVEHKRVEPVRLFLWLDWIYCYIVMLVEILIRIQSRHQELLIGIGESVFGIISDIGSGNCKDTDKNVAFVLELTQNSIGLDRIRVTSKSKRSG
jgi:hypothetical protein